MCTDTTLRSKFRRLSFQLIPPILALAWLAAPSNCRATPINYVFSGASTILDGVPETITGQFTFNTAFNTQSSVIITLSGPDPYAGTYSTASPYQQFYSNVIFAPYELNSDIGITIHFSDPLDISPDTLASVTLTRVGDVIDNSPLGEAIFATTSTTTVPEPSCLALLGTILAGLFLCRLSTNPRGKSTRLNPKEAEVRPDRGNFPAAMPANAFSAGDI